MVNRKIDYLNKKFDNAVFIGGYWEYLHSGHIKKI